MCLPPDFNDREWIARVRRNARPARTVFFSSVDDVILVRDPAAPGDDELERDLAAVAHVVAEARCAPGGRAPALWLAIGDERRACPTAPGSFTTAEKGILRSDAALDRVIAVRNREPVDTLVEQLRSPLQVAPFVGAGMSAAFGFPQWGEFLAQAADGVPDGVELARRAH